MKDKTYIIHIIESIDYIESYTANNQISLDDHKTYDAVLRQLQIMAESTQRLSDVVKEKYSKIKWREISGLRNILVHDYLGDIDKHIVWSIIKNNLPELKEAMKQSLNINH